jgi:hypothetical protein
MDEKNWLYQQIKAAASEVDTWKEWKRDAMHEEVSRGQQRREENGDRQRHRSDGE